MCSSRCVCVFLAVGGAHTADCKLQLAEPTARPFAACPSVTPSRVAAVRCPSVSGKDTEQTGQVSARWAAGQAAPHTQKKFAEWREKTQQEATCWTN